LSKKLNIVGTPLPNMPWEERPEGSNEFVLPLVAKPHHSEGSHSNFQTVSLTVLWYHSAMSTEAYLGLITPQGKWNSNAGRSKDGLNWEKSSTNRLNFICDDPEIGKFVYGYESPCLLDSTIANYVTWW